MVPVDRSRRSPNHGDRIGCDRPDMLVLHYTGMPSPDGAVSWLCDPRSQVSCHYVVFEDGRIAELVDEGRRAWHAGRSFWRGITDVNSHAIGVEIVNPGHEFGYRPFPEPQIAAVIALSADILARNPIAARNVVAHSDIAPDRKEDPGELFPWDRLAAAGIGHFVAPAAIVPGPVMTIGDAGPAVARLHRALADYGYPIAAGDVLGDDTATVLRAFQRHFRPALVDGRADISTLLTLGALRAALATG